jgi:hypothetical protein
MSSLDAPVITRYFEADARRDIDAIVALFTDEAVVVDEGQTYGSSWFLVKRREKLSLLLSSRPLTLSVV